MLKQKSKGSIVNITSVAGLLGDQVAHLITRVEVVL